MQKISQEGLEKEEGPGKAHRISQQKTLQSTMEQMHVLEIFTNP